MCSPTWFPRLEVSDETSEHTAEGPGSTEHATLGRLPALQGRADRGPHHLLQVWGQLRFQRGHRLLMSWAQRVLNQVQLGAACVS